ncbi:MAG TPA: hypothetical protein VFT16_05445, partial [Candidatus Saccharimonadales bacterium]|nr:hypothetical protein [Candidatus Saccharimonadales bacterium]
MIAIKDFGRSVLRAKLPGVRTIGKRAVLSTVPLSLFLGLVMASIPAELARAAVPNMRWNDSTTIEVYGGDLSGTNSYKLINQANRNAGIAFYGETIVTHKDNCQLKLAAQVTEGKNGAETDWSKAMLWVMAPGSGKNCFTEGSHTENRATYYDMGIESGSKLYTITDVNNRGKQGEEQTPAVVDDPEDKQIIKVALYPGWTNIYTTPNPSSPPKADELVPQEDLWTLCGNSNDPTKSWDPYRSSLGTPNYDQMEKDCLARKNGWVISSTRGPIKTQSSEPRISYSGQFTGVKFGDYTICDFITNSCRHEHKQPNKILTVDSWKTPANPLAKVPGAATDTEGTVNEPELACDITWDLSTVFSLKWLVCPVVNAATAAVGAMEDVINNLLTVDTKDIFNDSDTNNAYHTAWNSFRAFALGLIVIAALIMVVSQAAGIEILDAY